MGVVEIFAVFFLTVGAAYSWLAAWPGAAATRSIAGLQGWDGEVGFRAARRMVFWALMAHALASATMDAVTGTSQSLLYLIPTLDKPACAPNCFSFTPAAEMRSPIQSVGGYYRTVVGATPAHWLMYAVWQIPGLIVAFLVMVRMCPWSLQGRRHVAGLAVASVLSVGMGLALVMPLFVAVLVAALHGS